MRELTHLVLDWLPLILIFLFVFFFTRYRARPIQNQSLEILKDNNRLLKEQTDALKEIAATIAKLKS